MRTPPLRPRMASTSPIWRNRSTALVTWLYGVPTSSASTRVVGSSSSGMALNTIKRRRLTSENELMRMAQTQIAISPASRKGLPNSQPVGSWR